MAPYVYWRQAEFKGKYYNINDQGIRQTWNPSGTDGVSHPNDVQVFMFGGSTMWG